ncbi:MAG TPA: DUF3617 family protein [Xanthomonadaceae bacterium]|nr:DUF3617 family protein [Xanthomonadaceae bacterium]
MNNSIQNVRHRIRTTVVLRSFAVALLIASGLSSSITHADPSDFQAMPGLWMTTTSVVSHGHPGKPSIKWHCVFENNDPWVSFADLSIPGEQCKRSDEQRTSTALSWNLVCAGHSRASGQGRVDFDSAKHYTASIVLKNRGEVVHVEGLRRAACTDPGD